MSNFLIYRSQESSESETQKQNNDTKDLPTSLVDSINEEEKPIKYNLANKQASKSGLFPLLVSNIHPDVKHKMLFNLFSLYGNIDKIYVDNNKSEAIVYYEKEINQLSGKHYLKQIPLFGQQLKIYKISPTVCFNNITGRKSSGNSSWDSTLGCSRQKTINKPNKILYIFNLSKNVTLKILKDLFEKIECPEDIYYLNDSKNSALAFFRTLEVAVKVLCIFKNITLIDKNLKINFANESLVKFSLLNRER